MFVIWLGVFILFVCLASVTEYKGHYINDFLSQEKAKVVSDLDDLYEEVNKLKSKISLMRTNKYLEHKYSEINEAHEKDKKELHQTCEEEINQIIKKYKKQILDLRESMKLKKYNLLKQEIIYKVKESIKKAANE